MLTGHKLFLRLLERERALSYCIRLCMPALRALHFAGGSVYKHFFRGMAGHELHTLVLKSCVACFPKVDESGADAIKSLVRLSIIDMDPHDITCFKHCTNLRTLELKASAYAMRDAEDFMEGLPEVLEACPLEVLRVSHFVS